jgi:hypothetical protein
MIQTMVLSLDPADRKMFERIGELLQQIADGRGGTKYFSGPDGGGEDDLLPVSTWCMKLHISAKTFYKREKAGQFQRVELGPKTFRYRFVGGKQKEAAE